MEDGLSSKNSLETLNQQHPDIGNIESNNTGNRGSRHRQQRIKQHRTVSVSSRTGEFLCLERDHKYCGITVADLLSGVTGPRRRLVNQQNQLKMESQKRGFMIMYTIYLNVL